MANTDNNDDAAAAGATQSEIEIDSDDNSGSDGDSSSLPVVRRKPTRHMILSSSSSSSSSSSDESEEEDADAAATMTAVTPERYPHLSIAEREHALTLPHIDGKILAAIKKRQEVVSEFLTDTSFETRDYGHLCYSFPHPDPVAEQEYRVVINRKTAHDRDVSRIRRISAHEINPDDPKMAPMPIPWPKAVTNLMRIFKIPTAQHNPFPRHIYAPDSAGWGSLSFQRDSMHEYDKKERAVLVNFRGNVIGVIYYGDATIYRKESSPDIGCYSAQRESNYNALRNALAALEHMKTSILEYAKFVGDETKRCVVCRDALISASARRRGAGKKCLALLVGDIVVLRRKRSVKKKAKQQQQAE